MDPNPRYTELAGFLRRHFSESVYDPEGADEIHEYLVWAGSAAGVLLYAGLYCPPLVEIDGMVIQWLDRATPDDDYPRDVREYLDELGGDRAEVERSFNLVFVRRLLVPPDPSRPEMPREEERLLVETVAEAWRAWIHWRYRGRRFAVEVLEPEETGDVMGVTFYEQR